MKSEHLEAQALMVAVRNALARAKAEMSDSLDAAGIFDPDKRFANEMQNVLRVCIETCFNECVGFTEDLPVSMAFRLASYALSSLPDSKHEQALHFFVEHMREAHRDRMAKGIRLTMKWEIASPGTETKQ